MATRLQRYAMTSPTRVILNHVTEPDDAILYQQIARQVERRPKGGATATHVSGIRQTALQAAHVTLACFLCLTVLLVADGASIAQPSGGVYPNMSHIVGSAVPPTVDTVSSASGARPTFAFNGFLLPAAAPGSCRHVVVFVGSAPRHRDKRQAIRESWGSVTSLPDSSLSVLFVLGTLTSDLDPNTQEDILEESREHGDIIQGDFIDTYANLTLKTLYMLEWTARQCAGAKFIVKTDDDTFINTPLLIRDLGNIVHTRFIMGDVIAGARPIRDRKSKYYTPRGVFSCVMYPKYISGSAYVMSGDLVSDLIKAARATKLFWLEDVYITGLLASKISAKHLFNAKFAFHDQTLDPCWLARRIITLHRVTPKEMRTAWKLVQNFKDCQTS